MLEVLPLRTYGLLVGLAATAATAGVAAQITGIAEHWLLTSLQSIMKKIQPFAKRFRETCSKTCLHIVSD